MNENIINKKLCTSVFFKKCFLISIVLGVFLFSSCKPRAMMIKIYTTDLQAAEEGKIVDVPIEVIYSVLGDDDDSEIEKILNIASQYLAKDSEYSISSESLGKKLFLKTKIPMGNEAEIKKYLEKHQPLIVIEVSELENKKKYFQVIPTNIEKELNNKLENANIFMGYEFPASKINIEVINDLEKTVNVQATAVFVNGKGKLFYNVNLEKRDFTEITFSGEDGSVYKSIFPYVTYK